MMMKVKDYLKKFAVAVAVVFAAIILTNLGEEKASAGMNDDFSPCATGGAVTFTIEPGETQSRTTVLDNYIGTSNPFVNFYVKTDSELITAYVGSIYQIKNIDGRDRSELVFPKTDSSDKTLTFEYDGRYRFYFSITTEPNLPTDNYSMTLYGTYYDYFDTSKREVPVALFTFDLNNFTTPESIVIDVDSIGYNKNSFVPGTNQIFTLNLSNKTKISAKELFLEVDYGQSGIVPNYDMKKLKLGKLDANGTLSFKVPVSIPEDVKTGKYDISFNISGTDKYGNKIADISETLFVNVGGSAVVTDPAAPNITITTKQNYKTLEPGTEDSVKLKLTNNGKAKAQKVKLYAKGGFGVLEGLTKNFTSDYLEVKDIEPGKTVTVEVPFTVTNSFSKGIHELSFEVSYADEDKKSYTSETMTMYVEHYLTDSAPSDDTVRTYVQISNVKQSPSIPTAGDKVSVTFAVKNKGNAAISNLLFYGTNLSSAGFEPVSSEPYQNEGSLEVDESRTVTMNFRAGEDIPKGVNSLTIGYEFQDANYEIHTGSTTVYILNVSNSKFDDIDVGRPKIIVSDYTTDPEEIRAGSTFDFTYTLRNTHQTKAAKNIKITLSQDEGVFSPAEGTNIFYIEMMEPGNESVITLPLKTKGDTATGDYGVKLLLEYEYDDMSEIDREHGGVSEENVIKIHAIENYRPEIENIYIDSYNGVMVGQPVDLSFEFYNMGKSTLGNVYITVEGDFVLANNSAMSYVGAVAGYGQEYLCPQVVPLVSGEAYGTVTIHFEDSNGDEQTKSAEFTAWVNEEMGFEDWDPSFEDWDPSFEEGFDDPFMEDGEGFLASIPWWGYVIAGVVVAGGITVLVIVLVKKSKKRRLAKEEEDDDEDI